MNKSSQRVKKVKQLRKGDPYMDRRSGEDRRKIYSLDYFLKGNIDRRIGSERRIHGERRMDCVRVSKWASVCPDPKELDNSYFFKIDLESELW